VRIDISKDQQERCKALLTVDELPLTVVTGLHHDWLEEVLPARAFADVIEKPGDLFASPAIPSLVTRYKELPDDVADKYGPQLGSQLWALTLFGSGDDHVTLVQAARSVWARRRSKFARP
jgi:hypothetical protein